MKKLILFGSLGFFAYKLFVGGKKYIENISEKITYRVAGVGVPQIQSGQFHLPVRIEISNKTPGFLTINHLEADIFALTPQREIKISTVENTINPVKINPYGQTEVYLNAKSNLLQLGVNGIALKNFIKQDKKTLRISIKSVVFGKELPKVDIEHTL